MTEEKMLRWVTYLISVVGACGLALSLGGQIGGTLGWLVVLIFGAVPGGFLIRQHLSESEAQRVRASAAGAEPWRGEDDEIPTASMSQIHRDAERD